MSNHCEANSFIKLLQLFEVPVFSLSAQTQRGWWQCSIVGATNSHSVWRQALRLIFSVSLIISAEIGVALSQWLRNSNSNAGNMDLQLICTWCRCFKMMTDYMKIRYRFSSGKQQPIHISKQLKIGNHQFNKQYRLRLVHSSSILLMLNQAPCI